MNRELHEEFASLVRRQAQEHMALVAVSQESKANYFRNTAEAGLKGIQHLYGRNKAGCRDCKSLLKALSMNDKVLTRKQIQKVEVSVGENPTQYDEIVKPLLAPQGNSGNSRSLTFRLRQQPKEPKGVKKQKDPKGGKNATDARGDATDEPLAGTSTGGSTPWGSNAIGGKKSKGKKRTPS